MNLPQELLDNKIPTFTELPGKILIRNKVDIAMCFSLAVLLSFLAIVHYDELKYKTDLTFFGIALILIQLWRCFSLEHVTIDIAAKKISRHSNNSIVNSYRRKFKILTEINFNAINSIDNEVPWGQTLIRKNLIYVTTKESFKIGIATFTSEERSIIFEKFLHTLLNMHDAEFKGWDFLHI